ncbi:MAG: PAS domain-containing sensor histidine kinase [Desulfovibrio sp.]|nr:MAG: PAS domain-containing sensor histidine kinase [Desulfovibrio sp.]
MEERTAKLRQSEETSRKISAHAHDGLIMLDNAGQVSFWNQAAETISGYRTEDMEGLGLEAIFTDPEDWRLHREGYGSFQATGEGQVVGRTVELKARRKGGEIFDVELSVSALRIKDQWCALGIVRDVTLRKQSREALREAKEAAEAANKLKSEFLSMVSHELRTPLTSVVGFAKVIKKRLEETLIPALNLATDKQQRHLGQVESNIAVIISEGERLTELINNVLDLAKLEAGHFEWRMEQVDVTDVVFRSLEATRILFKRKGLTVEERVSQDLPRVRGDLDRLMQVLINLLANAAKFTEQGRVVCRAEVKDGTVVLSVEDTGVGMEPHELEHIFDKFTQIGDTLTDKPRGTGLGLPISKEIVEHHGGSMWVKSRPGQGSVFSFSIPA